MMTAPILWLNDDEFINDKDEPLHHFESRIQIYCPIQVYDQNQIFYLR